MLTSGQVGELISHTRHTVLDLARQGELPYTLDKKGQALYREQDVFDYIMKLYKATPVDNLWGAWFSGLVDGEGHFAITKNAHDNGYQAHFEVGLRIEEEPIIREINQNLQCGSVYISPRSYMNKFGQPIARKAAFYIHDLRGCLKLVDLLEMYPLRANKKEDFAIWKTFVYFKRDLIHRVYTPEDITKMDEMYKAIRSVRIDRKIQ